MAATAGGLCKGANLLARLIFSKTSSVIWTALLKNELPWTTRNPTERISFKDSIIPSVFHKSKRISTTLW